MYYLIRYLLEKHTNKDLSKIIFELYTIISYNKLITLIDDYNNCKNTKYHRIRRPFSIIKYTNRYEPFTRICIFCSHYIRQDSKYYECSYFYKEKYEIKWEIHNNTICYICFKSLKFHEWSLNHKHVLYNISHISYS